MRYGLGRRPSVDSRDDAFPMSMALPIEAPGITHRYWNAEGWWGDQGSTSQCVAYAWTHWLEDGPITQPKTPHGGAQSVVRPFDLYREAQKVDEWPGEDYDGTSVRAGAKVLQSMGFVREYRWAFTVDTVVKAVLSVGPVVVGTNWYSGMFEPDSEGLIDVTGGVVGGHAYVLNGVNVRRGLFRVKNSWGRDWGRHGHALIGIEDMSRLINEQGEACLAVEVQK